MPSRSSPIPPRLRPFCKIVAFSRQPQGRVSNMKMRLNRLLRCLTKHCERSWSLGVCESSPTLTRLLARRALFLCSCFCVGDCKCLISHQTSAFCTLVLTLCSKRIRKRIPGFTLDSAVRCCLFLYANYDQPAQSSVYKFAKPF